jgi:predicted nucleotidyltransferase
VKRITDRVLKEMVDAIVREFDPERVIVFGSRARGEDTPESDVDLLVIESEPFGAERSRWQEVSRLWGLVARFRVPVDVLLYSQDEFEHWRKTRSHVIARAVREGRPLYERP